MARQKGMIKLEGSIGDISFYKNEGTYFARTKGGVDADRIKNDPAFVRTRENGQEFGRAGKASKLIRNAMKVMIAQSADNRVASRLTTALLKVVQSDSENKRGERTVVNGDLSLLKGFEFNRNNGLENMLKAPYTVAFDRASGAGSVNVEFSNPSLELNVVDGAEFVKLSVGVVAVDFENGEYEVDVVESDVVDVTSVETADITINASISEASELPVLVVFGAAYYQEVNGAYYLINSQESKAMVVVATDQA